jgi:transposase
MPQSRLSPDQVDFITKMKGGGIQQLGDWPQARCDGGCDPLSGYKGPLGKEDGRRLKPSLLERFRKDYEDDRRPLALKTLYEWLRRDQGCRVSCDAFRRYIRKHYPQFRKKGAWIRVETPPGALSFADWKEDLLVQMGRPEYWLKIQGLCFALGFSRKMAVRFSARKDLESFVHGHQEAFRQFGRLPRVVRTDCLKSAVVRWEGANSVLNESYRRYMNGLGVDVFPPRPGAPKDKGKMEKRIRDIFGRLDFRHRIYRDMVELQAEAYAILTDLEKEWRCGPRVLALPRVLPMRSSIFGLCPLCFLQG